MTEPFADRPSGLAQMKRVAKSEFRWIGVVVVGGIVALVAIFWAIRHFDLGSVKRERETADSLVSQNERKNFQVFIEPLTKKLDSMAREVDSLKNVVKMLQSDLNFYYPPVKPSTEPTRWDTAKIFEQKPEEKK